MQTHILEQEAGRAKIKVEVPAQDVGTAFEQVLRSLARQVRVPGFRPGKAPRGVIEARVGKDAVAQEVRDALVQTYFPQAVRELSLTPVAQHLHAHEPVDGEAYSFEAELELYPEFSLPDLSEIVFDTETPPLTDEMVQETIDALRSQNAALIPVERSAEAGDYLMVETLGAEGQEGSSIPVDLENVAPELAEQFLGKAIGDEIDLTLLDEAGDDHDHDHTHDHDHDHNHDHEPEAAEETAEGAAADTASPEDETAEAAEPMTLRVVVRDIKAKERPEVDDEFAKTLGFETWAEADAQIRDNLRAQLEQEALSAQQEEFTEKLLLETTTTVPPSLKARRKESMLQNLARDLEQRELTLQGYLESLESDEKRQEFEQELDESAEEAVKRDLVLEKLLEQRGTTLSNEEFEAALAYTAQRQNNTPQQLRGQLGESGLANYRFLLTRDKAVRETVQELLAAQRGSAPDETTREATPETTRDAPSDSSASTPVESDV